MVNSDTTIRRRNVLTGLAGAALLFPIPSRGQVPALLGKAEFLQISSLVTGFPVAELTGLADPLFAAFQAQSALLLQILAVGRRTPPEGFLVAIAGGPLESACQQLAGAWYTGMLGMGRNATMVSYDDALSWRAAGYDVTPGSCAGDFGAWAESLAPH